MSDVASLFVRLKSAIWLEAAEIVSAVASAHREGEYGDEMTMREVRDGIEHAADRLRELSAEADAQS